MTVALITIILMRVKVEWRAVIFGLFGAIIGLILGLYLVC